MTKKKTKLPWITILSILFAVGGFFGILYDPGNFIWVMLLVVGLVGYFRFREVKE